MRVGFLDAMSDDAEFGICASVLDVAGFQLLGIMANSEEDEQ